MGRVKFGPRQAALLLAMALGASGILAATPSVVQASQSAHTVPIDCASQGVPDSRSAYDASVQPGVIVPDFTGYPYLAADLHGIRLERSDPTRHRSSATIDEVETTDHLVSAWESSTNCFGSARR